MLKLYIPSKRSWGNSYGCTMGGTPPTWTKNVVKQYLKSLDYLISEAKNKKWVSR